MFRMITDQEGLLMHSQIYFEIEYFSTHLLLKFTLMYSRSFSQPSKPKEFDPISVKEKFIHAKDLWNIKLIYRELLSCE
ncbi:hypothetical protein GIB67_019175 [Kingdonia uniflora]|uniref:Uncharacterized protein n=1 Tax=Kingdonia uniflora TaxID=39325 RepID=A0A7J7MZU7_9MAGN|nr:hypothetical protein GIB67_019175 [Kingdonia uniflora]